MATLILHHQEDEEVEVTPDFCYQKAAECIIGSYNGSGLETAKQWRELGDSIFFAYYEKVVV